MFPERKQIKLKALVSSENCNRIEVIMLFFNDENGFFHFLGNIKTN